MKIRVSFYDNSVYLRCLRLKIAWCPLRIINQQQLGSRLISRGGRPVEYYECHSICGEILKGPADHPSH